MEDPGEIKFVAWKDTCLFHNLLKNIKSARDYYASKQTQNTEDQLSEDIIAPSVLKTIASPVTFKGKVKLHGSNAGVALHGSELKAQSRSHFIGKGGFGTIVFGHNESFWRGLVVPGGPQTFTVYGEYCGPGVQKGVALAKLKVPILAVFGIDIGSQLIVEPEDIKDFLTRQGTVQLPSNVFVLPWHPTEYVLELSDETDEKRAAMQKVLDVIDEEVQKIDAKDPWVKEVFGVEGPGEGLVLYPVSLLEDSPVVPKYRTLARSNFGSFAFKAKGEAHRVVQSKKSVTIDPAKAANAEAFAKLMCPLPRLEQGATAVGGYDIAKIRDFLGWMAADVQKEGLHELEVSNLSWDDVYSPITKLCSAWYAKQVKERATSAPATSSNE
jgi:hypothetical protein